ncbi:MAG: hypothetical protein QG597_3061 [Actinomycetota bacterium]|jgi:hypothetical protein|nr:hypothetical protein [Actinomycetota bacterium]
MRKALLAVMAAALLVGGTLVPASAAPQPETPKQFYKILQEAWNGWAEEDRQAHCEMWTADPKGHVASFAKFTKGNEDPQRPHPSLPQIRKAMTKLFQWACT